MKIHDILKIENERDEKELKTLWTMRMFHEGKFYHLYQRSAWIMTRFREEIKLNFSFPKEEKIKVISIGFPVDKLEKWVPKGFEIVKSDEDRVDLLPTDEFLKDCQSLEESIKEYVKWYESVKPVEKKEQVRRDVSFNSFSDIWLKVLTFPTEKSTPLECMDFIGEIKTDIAKKMRDN